MQEKESKTNIHFRISVIKSTFRIIACIFLMNGKLLETGALLLLAEILGIAEEIF
jgi:hypothetical protein